MADARRRKVKLYNILQTFRNKADAMLSAGLQVKTSKFFLPKTITANCTFMFRCIYSRNVL